MLQNLRGEPLTNKATPLTTTELSEAEHEIIKLVQQKNYKDEMATLSKEGHPCLKKSSSLQKLNPVMDNGALRIKGRLSYSTLDTDQYILPKDHHVTKLIIRHYHLLSGHSGRQHVLSMMREKFWVIKANSAVRRVLSRCVDCQKRQGRVGEQQMADLPEVRLDVNKPPFSSTGLDYFGPFLVKRGRARVKRYALLFTCLTTRASHIEVSYSLDTDSFLSGVNRFIARRGKPKIIYSDNGGSFVRGEREIREGIERWNQSAIHANLLQQEIDWHFNPPLGSHHGGIWERSIRTARKILNALLQQQTVDDEGLHTLLCEVESVMNARPITTVSSDHQDLEPMTPNHLLLFKAGDGKLPLDVFDNQDPYRRRWRQIQHLADVFWRRWIKEYLPLLKSRQKWTTPRKNLEVGNLVLLVDPFAPRNVWPLGTVVQVHKGRDGLVRQAEVRTRNGLYKRPIDKLILLDKMID